LFSSGVSNAPGSRGGVVTNIEEALVDSRRSKKPRNGEEAADVPESVPGREGGSEPAGGELKPLIGSNCVD
jgi:hypothetical protein